MTRLVFQFPRYTVRHDATIDRYRIDGIADKTFYSVASAQRWWSETHGR